MPGGGWALLELTDALRECQAASVMSRLTTLAAQHAHHVSTPQAIFALARVLACSFPSAIPERIGRLLVVYNSKHIMTSCPTFDASE